MYNEPMYNEMLQSPRIPTIDPPRQDKLIAAKALAGFRREANDLLSALRQQVATR